MRVLIVEDHHTTILGIKTVLELEKGMEVVGEARNSEDAVNLTRRLEPDLVILDLKLRGENNGIELCREIKSFPSSPRLLIYTAYNCPEEVSACRLSGADGYVHKSEDAGKFLEAVEKVYAGEQVWFLGGEVEDAETRIQVAGKDADLTLREGEIVTLLLRRRTNNEIANDLFISPLTVKTHVSNILGKLNLRSRKEIG